MFDWLGETDKGATLDQAMAAVVKEGKVRTYDMGGNNTSLEVAEAVAEQL
jgi:3-isopropylmalate dehydrogenase